jgi:hypothetical protein
MVQILIFDGANSNTLLVFEYIPSVDINAAVDKHQDAMWKEKSFAEQDRT